MHQDASSEGTYQTQWLRKRLPLFGIEKLIIFYSSLIFFIGQRSCLLTLCSVCSSEPAGTRVNLSRTTFLIPNGGRKLSVHWDCFEQLICLRFFRAIFSIIFSAVLSRLSLSIGHFIEDSPPVQPVQKNRIRFIFIFFIQMLLNSVNDSGELPALTSFRAALARALHTFIHFINFSIKKLKKSKSATCHVCDSHWDTLKVSFT